MAQAQKNVKRPQQQNQTTERAESAEERQKRHHRHQLRHSVKEAKTMARQRWGNSGVAVFDDASYLKEDERCRVGVQKRIVLREGRYDGFKMETAPSMTVFGVGGTWQEAFNNARRNA